MNRSILIVICDFLLVSLLVFSTPDMEKVAPEGKPAVVRLEIATNSAGSGKDLTAVMRQALEEERRSRDLLMGELSKTRQSLAEHETRLTEREQQVRQFQQDLEQREQQARQLELAQASLQGQVALAQTNITGLTERLRDTSIQAMVSKERLAAMEAELKKQVEQAAALQQQMTQLQQSNQSVLNERQRLASQLQVAEVERRHAAEQVASVQEQVKVEREEKTRLAEGVKALAKGSQELTKEIRENRPLAANTIFFDVLTNRVDARFNAMRTGAFGIDASKHKETSTILLTDGTNTFAICHVEDTPLVFWNPGTDWESFSGTLAGNKDQIPLRAVSFYRRDPRLVMIPVTPAEVKQLGCKVYRSSPDPFKFGDAVLIGAREGYYGECRFQIDATTTPDYVKLDNNFLKGLFGKFNPTRGDLVFSKNGDLLGIMANNTYCLLIQNFNTVATFQFTADARAQRTGRTLAQLYSMVEQLPPKLR